MARWSYSILHGCGQWKWNNYSIIAPQDLTFYDFELYPYRGDVGRFQTLGEAKRAAYMEWMRRGFKPGCVSW